MCYVKSCLWRPVGANKQIQFMSTKSVLIIYHHPTQWGPDQFSSTNHHLWSEQEEGGDHPAPPTKKKAAVCDILRRQQPQHLLVFSFSWEFLSAHGLKSCMSARSPSSQYRDPKGALAWNNNVSRSTEMQEVQPGGGGTKNFCWLVRCLLSSRMPASIRRLVFYSWGRKQEKV